MTGAGTGELTTDGTGKGAVRLPGAHSANRRADYWRCRRVSEPTRLLSPVSRLASQVSRPLSQVSPGLCPVFPAISPPQSETQRTARVAWYQSACLVFAEAPPEGQMIRGIQTTPRGRRTPPAPRPGRSRQIP